MFFGHGSSLKLKYRFCGFLCNGSSPLSEVNLKCINGSVAFSSWLILCIIFTGKQWRN